MQPASCSLPTLVISASVIIAVFVELLFTFTSYSVRSADGWLSSRVVSVLDSGAEGPCSNRSRDAVG